MNQPAELQAVKGPVSDMTGQLGEDLRKYYEPGTALVQVRLTDGCERKISFSVGNNQIDDEWARSQAEIVYPGSTYIEFAVYPEKNTFAAYRGKGQEVRRSCPDGGTCHHSCQPEDDCWRKDGCVPLTGSGLDDNWDPTDA